MLGLGFFLVANVNFRQCQVVEGYIRLMKTLTLPVNNEYVSGLVHIGLQSSMTFWSFLTNSRQLG